MWERVRVLVCDFDGTIASQHKILMPDGSKGKMYSGRDGFGVEMIQRKCGVRVFVITNEDSPSTRAWCKDHDVKMYVCEHGTSKEHYLDLIVRTYNLDYDTICYIGDDVTDVCPMCKCAMSVAPADCHYSVRYVDGVFISQYEGGNGVVRDVVDRIMWDRGIKCPVSNRIGASCGECDFICRQESISVN